MIPILLSGSVLAAPTYPRDVKNLPDFFQHQQWGARALTNGSTDTAANNSWENGGGWCKPTSLVNQFFYFDKMKIEGNKPFDKILPDGTKAVHYNAAILKMHKNYFKDSATKGDVNKILKARDVGPNKGTKKGLIMSEHFREGGKVKYNTSAGGAVTEDVGAKTLFDICKTLINNGDSATLILKHDTKTDDRWWGGTGSGNYHAVTLAGYELSPDKVWFADPDSNPDPRTTSGNKNANAGWACTGKSGAKPAVNPIKKRRFEASDGIPVPAASPSAEDKSKRWVVAKVTDDELDPDADFNRYKGVKIDRVLALTVVGGATKIVIPPTATAGQLKLFEVSPGKEEAIPIDEFWLFPAGDAFVPATPPEGWTVEMILPAETDPWGNSRSFGGAHFFAESPSDAMFGTVSKDFPYETSSGKPLISYDIVFGYDGLTDNLRVQVFGGELTAFPEQQPPPDCVAEVVPTVSEWRLVVLMLLLVSAIAIKFGRRRAVG